MDTKFYLDMLESKDYDFEYFSSAGCVGRGAAHATLDAALSAATPLEDASCGDCENIFLQMHG